MMHCISLLSFLSCLFTIVFSYPTSHSSDNIHPCAQPKQSGLCLAYFPSFYYDSATGKCDTFIYGGCQGNANRFTTLHECMEKCANFKPETHDVKLIRPSFDSAFTKEAVSAEETEEQPLEDETRETSAAESSATGDQSSQSAEVKASAEEASKTVEETSPSTAEVSSARNSETTDDCKLPSDTGSCRAFFPRFYFNGNSCEQFTYGGCEGNSNNFKTIDECVAKCGSTPSTESTTTSNEQQTVNKAETST